MIHKEIIPYIVKISSDYEMENKCLAFDILSHFIRSTPVEQLSFFDQVVFKIIRDNMVFRDLPFFSNVLTCANDFCRKMKSVTYCDSIVEDVFNSCIYISTRDQRIVAQRNFATLISIIGIDFVKYLKRFEHVILSPEFLDPSLLPSTILCLNAAITECWPRFTLDRKKRIYETIPQESRNLLLINSDLEIVLLG